MIRASDLKYYYPNALGTSDGQALTAYEVTYVADSKTFRCDSDQADDFWNDAIFYGVTGVNVADQWNHIKTSTLNGIENDLVLATNLPGNPTITDTFKIIHTGKNNAYRSTEEVPGFLHTDPVNVTGVDITYVSYTNGLGDGTISYTSSGQILQWAAPGDILGAGVAASAAVDMTLYSADDSKWIRVYVTNLGNLPVGDETDTDITLTQPNIRVIPNTEAYQSEVGITRYIGLFIKNENLVDQMNEIKAWIDPRVDASTTTTSGVTTDAGYFTVTDATSFPAQSFWLINLTRDDCRYIRYRSGNTLYASGAGVGLRGKSAVAWSAGDDISIWTDVDIAIGTLTSDHLGVLSGYTYSSPTAYDDGLDYGNLVASDINAICLREVVIDTVYPIDSILTQLHFKWW